MKKLLAIAVAIMFVVGVGVAASIAADAPKGPMKVSNFGDKAPVTLNHATHTSVKCDYCHHNEKDGKYKCGECHKKDAAGKAPSIKDAAHAKETGRCWECHFKASPKVKKELKCADCHKE